MVCPFTILAFILVLVNCDVNSKLNEPYNIGGSLGKLCPLCDTYRNPGPGSPGTQSCCDSSQGVVLGVDIYITQNPKKPAIPVNPGQRFSYRSWEYVIYYEVKGNSRNLVVTKLFRMLCHCLFWGAKYDFSFQG